MIELVLDIVLHENMLFLPKFPIAHISLLELLLTHNLPIEFAIFLNLFV